MKLTKKCKTSGVTVTELNEGFTYVSSKNMTFTLDDDKQRTFGVLFETVDMYDATGDAEFKNYPFVVSASLMVNKLHPSFFEGEGKPDAIGLMLDCNGYMGGVCVDHVLTHEISCATEAESEPDASNFEKLANQFKVNEACVKTNKHDFGTIAAQYGRGTEFSYLQFKTEAAARKYVSLLTERVPALSMLIGFILDRPLNMVGDSGWKTFETQVKGRRS